MDRLLAQMNVISLAFVGDSVFTLFVRKMLVLEHDYNAAVINKEANKFVCAAAQARMFERIFPLLNEDEQTLCKRARNAHTNNKAKNSTAADYKKATALEALIGYYFLAEKFEKLNALLNECVNKGEKPKDANVRQGEIN